ncbi:ATP-binding protein [Qipengyuania marisflavi]|uniref:ATP-binding protein n=1 Tax=Qipengyuania marisflavi TaxID=2486356 RepID=A0A5S3P635_9SPHN|nr:ATP-binding protein [Qipengyuania marisflavi]TMM48678.1 ATP-binding protein [Qipengyuania marisflavi]
MTALKHSPETTIQQIQTLLQEGYGTGFTIFKELIQNADDGGATRLLLAGHDGFPEAENLLLRVPGLFVANDGNVTRADWEGLQKAAGGSKGGQEAAVGRYGLGQKALYHLCDAYAVFARLDGAAEATSMVLNPYEDIPVAHHAQGWKELSRLDEALLATWAEAAGMSGGLVLRIPLRTESLRPGDDRQMRLTGAHWTAQEAITDIRDGQQLLAALACLRRLESIEITCPGEQPWRAEVRPGFARLAGPGAAAQEQMQESIGGSLVISGMAATVHGAQRNAAGGKADALRHDPEWPKIWTLTGLDRDKATPHGGAIVCRHPVAEGAQARLRVWDAVYLPLGDPARERDKEKVPLVDAALEGKENVELIVHGDFFVSSDRRSLHRGNDIKARWNAELQREAALPCVLNAVASAVAALPDNPARYGLIRALQEAKDWWLANAAAICGERALACVADGTGQRWGIEPAATLRPVPVGEATRPRMLDEAWPGFAEWRKQHGIVLAQGGTLSAAAPTWSDSELAAIIDGMGQAAWSSMKAAKTLSALLEAPANGFVELGELAQQSLGESLRAALIAKSKMAPTVELRKLTRHLRPAGILVLPKSVSAPELLAHLAQNAPLLCLRDEWVAEEIAANRADSDQELPENDAFALLEALEPLGRREGKVRSEAISLLGRVLAKGPHLGSLAQHVRVSALKVIPARRAGDGGDALLAPAEARALVDKGLLFQQGGKINLLDSLAQAVTEPTLWSLRQNVTLKMSPGTTLSSSNTPAHLAAVLGKARAFGSVAARANQFKELKAQMSPQQMRCLLTGQPDLQDEPRVARIADLPSPLKSLADQISADERGLHILDPDIARHIAPDDATKARVEELGIDWLGSRLKRSQIDLTEHQAEALLSAQLPSDTLVPLALHRVQGEGGLHRCSNLLRGRLAEVPQAMRHLVRIVDPYPAQAGQRQRDLIADWTPERQITIALGSERPEDFAADIFAALEKLPNLSDDLAKSLREGKWLRVNGRTVAPGDLRDFLPCVLDAWPAFPLGIAPALIEKLPQDQREILQRLKLVHTRLASYRLLLQNMAQHRSGLVVDLREQRADLCALAKAGRRIDDDLWPLLSSALRAIEDDERWSQLLTGITFPAPDEDAAIDQLNALAELASDRQEGRLSEAARNLWRAGYAAHVEGLRAASEFLPADLLVESEAGTFSRADCLALARTGLEDTACLAAHCGFERPENHAPPRTSATIAGEPLERRIGELFAPFRKFHELHSAVLMVLAMLGRGPELRRVAGQFQGNPNYEDICADIADCSKRRLGAYENIQAQQFTVVPLQEGQALVMSAAGVETLARSGADGTLLYDCTKLAPNHWQLTMSASEPRDLDHATTMLREAVSKLADPITMRMHEQRGALLQLLDSYLASDQATLDNLIEDIQDGLYERVKKLDRSDYLKQALSIYDADHKTGRREGDEASARNRAKENLWQAIKREEAAGELLQAIREKIHRRGYAPERTLFELFQNAVDAAHQNGQQTDMRVEAERDENGTIATLRVIHWGRPINVAGGPRTPQRFERDLDNMLDMDSSEKASEDRGKHGLGFKTCHMLSDETRVASGRLRFAIRGGMIPLNWEKGRDLQLKHNLPDAPATIIEMPIAPGMADAAKRAFDQFARVAEFLPVVASDLGEVVLFDNLDKPSGKALVQSITPTIALVEYGQDKRTLRLDLGAGHQLYLRLLDGMPSNFAKDWSRLWNLAPLDGEDLRTEWLIDGNFEMDQGRRKLHGEAASALKTIQMRGAPLGERLLELFDKWDTIAPAAGLAEQGRDAFFAALIDRMMHDLNDHLAQYLHGASGGELRGLAALIGSRAVVPLASGRLVSANEVDGVYSHTLADPEVRKKVEGWPGAGDAKANHVEENWANRLQRLGFAAPETIDLGTMARRICRSQITAETAAMVGEVFNASERERWFPEERKRVEDALKDVQLRAADGKFVQVHNLWFAQDPRQGQEGETERLRAAFMPPQARLHPDYQARGVDFAQLARSIKGYSTQIEREHLKDAHRDHARCEAALIYLAQNPKAISGLNWLSDADALLAQPAHQELSSQQLGTLLAWLNADAPTPTPPPVREAEDILWDIAEWWETDRTELVEQHDMRTYGELEDLCSAQKLQADDDTAWFTMLSLASFQTLGRITPKQSRNFVLRGVREDWWHELASVEDEALTKYAQRLWVWSEIGADEDFQHWRRCLGDMCLIARNLDAYRQILTALPQMVEQVANPFSLRELLRPSQSQIIARMGIDAAPLARSIGMGANWIVRELARRGFYEPDEAQLVQPFAWSARQRIRNFSEEIGLGTFSPGVDEGRRIHDEVAQLLEAEPPFGIDGDLPLEILNTRTRSVGYPLARQQILSGSWNTESLPRLTIDA